GLEAAAGAERGGHGARVCSARAPRTRPPRHAPYPSRVGFGGRGPAGTLVPMTDPTSLPNFPPPPQERPLSGRVLDALQDLQMSPNLDKEGDVAFEVRDQRMFVKIVQGEQFDIMRVFGQWQVAGTVPDDLLTRLNGCNDVTLGVNLVKAGIAGGN